jgi:hypothetical protein
LSSPWPKATLARLNEIEREFHVHAFGEELARVNLDLTIGGRRRYLEWMRQLAQRHGVARRLGPVAADGLNTAEV